MWRPAVLRLVTRFLKAGSIKQTPLDLEVEPHPGEDVEDAH